MRVRDAWVVAMLVAATATAGAPPALPERMLVPALPSVFLAGLALLWVDANDVVSRPVTTYYALESSVEPLEASSRPVTAYYESPTPATPTDVASRSVSSYYEAPTSTAVTSAVSRPVGAHYDPFMEPPSSIAGIVVFDGVPDLTNGPHAVIVRVELQWNHALIGEYTRPVDADGRWSLPLPYGDFLVTMHADGFLDKKRYVFGIDFPDQYVDFWIVNGDCDRDNDVDIDDYDVLAGAYGTFVDDALFNARADLDRDGDVDIDDYDILAGAYGQFGD